jgi:hypothetical protein
MELLVGVILAGQKKSARWISPRISQRALFPNPSHGPCSVDFPPEINSKQVTRLLEAGALKRRTSFRTKRSCLKIRRVEAISGVNSGQVVSKSAIRAEIGVGSQGKLKIHELKARIWTGTLPIER